MKLTDPPSSEVPQDHSESLSPFLPLILFGLAALIFIGVEMKNEIARRSVLTLAIQQRQQPVSTAKQVRAQLDKLAIDIVQLAETDAETRNIATKFRIQVLKKGEQQAK